MNKGYYCLSEDKKNPMCVIVAILLLIVIFVLAWLLPDQGSEKIKQLLEERGYSVADIDFTRTKKLGNIYISSQPIAISSGVTCEYWQLVSYGTFGTFQGVYPYPDGWPEPVSVSIIFEPEEYKEILKESENDSVENYIKEKLLTEIIE